jgi:hypothetical protein
MNHRIAAVVAFACLAGVAQADYGVIDRGEWPESWPKELEPLRDQARSLYGPLRDNQHFAIPFAKREEFEAAWPHLLSVKSKGTSIVLKRGENFFLKEGSKAGVVIHLPPKGQEGKTYLELVVDGDVVDLNRLPLPKETSIDDERFGKD